MEVDLSQDMDILFTYTVDSLMNPTVVKNSYSRTVVLRNTNANSKIFGQFWNLERIQSTDGEYGVSFNPSKRVPFEIYVNGDVYQNGYCKLMNVKRTGNNILYEVTLYGGLGSFFFNLSYSGDDMVDDNKKKLSDLHFMTWDSSTPSENEFDFTIKKETIQEAWNNVQGTESTKWHYINFAPSYDGYPGDFDADKVLINTQGTSGFFTTRTATTENSYATFDGYMLAELPNEKTADEMREFRSYLMRPVVRVKEVINACCAPENNGGFNVELDPSFFNQDNPYWENAWMTLPLLTSMDYNGSEGDEQTGVTATVGSRTTGGTWTGDIYKETYAINLGTISAASSFNFAMDINLEMITGDLPSGYVTTDSKWERDRSRTGGMYMWPQAIYPCAYSVRSNTYYPGAIEVQLVAYSRDGKVIAGSDIMNCTSVYTVRRTGGSGRGGGGGQTVTDIPTPNNFPQYDPEFESAYKTVDGSFNYDSALGNYRHKWVMGTPLTFSLKKLPKTCTLKLVVTKLNSASNYSGSKAMYMFQRYYSDYTKDSEGYVNSSYSLYYRTPITVQNFGINLLDAQVSIISDEGIRTGAKFKKADLLNTDYSPCDFMLSYAKLFGLYFEKDKYEDTIYIRDRETFYNKSNEVMDLSAMVDRSREIKITPMVFDAKWYNWKLQNEKSLFGEQYKATYGIEYGTQRVNTGYNFDSSERDLYTDNIFHGGIEAMEKSEMFSYVSADTVNKPWMFDGYSYDLYATDDLSETTEIEVQPKNKKGVLKSFSTYKYYDLFSKLQLHSEDNNPSDGSMILCFFNGMVEPKSDEDVTIHYWITDDNSYMNTLNDGKPCWLYTVSSADTGGQNIAILAEQIPQFTRYKANRATGYISQAWDFGVPKQLFVPYYNTDYDTTIYTNYWRSYITDMYDINTKKLECYVKFDQRPMEDWLRGFYWFDNCIWRINAITDFNILGKDTTKVEFIKVQDIANYTNINVSSLPYLTLIPSTTAITNNQTTVTVQVIPSDGGGWFVSDYAVEMYGAYPESGHGTGTFTLTIPANQSDVTKTHKIMVENDYDRWFGFEIVQGNSMLEVNPTGGSGNIPWTGGTCVYGVRATYPWTVSLDRTYVTVSPVSGTGNTQTAEHFTLDWEASDSMAPRNVKITVTDTAGNSVSLTRWQEKTGVLEFNATGGSKTLHYMSGASAVTPDWLTVTDNGNDTYTFTAQPNAGEVDRQGGVYFTWEHAGGYIEVKQYCGDVLSLTRNDGSGSVSAGGGPVRFTVICNTNPWTISANNTACTFNMVSGNGNTTALTAYFTGNSGYERQITLTLTDATGNTVNYTITQSGSQMPGDNFVDPGVLLFDNTGGTDTFDITTTHSWIIPARPSWISVSSTGGTGNATITVTASTNPDLSTRSGTIVVVDTSNGKTYQVTATQSEGNEEIFTITRKGGTGSVMASGGVVTIGVVSNRNPWTVTASTADCTLTPSSSTVSDDTEALVAANTGDQRQITLTFTNALGHQKTYTITQNGDGMNDSLVINPAVLNFAGTEDSSAFTITTLDEWRIVGKPSWITADVSAGTGNTTVTLTASTNHQYERTGSVVIADLTWNKNYILTVTQATGDVFMVARVNGSGDIPSTGGLCYLEVTSPNKAWTASTSDSFISLDKTSWTASTGLYVTFTSNTGSNRVATINFVDANNNHLTFTQSQFGSNAQGGWVNPSYLDYPSTGGTGSTYVEVNTEDPWQIVAYPNWVSFSQSTGTGYTQVVITAIPYSGSETRTGTIVFYDSVTKGTALVTVNQNASSGELLAVSPTEIRYTPNGGVATLRIITNTDWTIG